MTVTYTTVNIANGGGSANLLINPRGKINQANESQGVLVAGKYFCDGWKAGPNGAEVYIDADGFRLISGSIVQLVPNNISAGKRIRANMDKVSGAPTIRINDATDSVLANSDQYIKVEISGNNSKFNRIVLAESEELPIYQQLADELEPCKRFLTVFDGRIHTHYYAAAGLACFNRDIFFEVKMHKAPSIQLFGSAGQNQISDIKPSKFHVNSGATYSSYFDGYIADARP